MENVSERSVASTRRVAIAPWNGLIEFVNATREQLKQLPDHSARLRHVQAALAQRGSEVDGDGDEKLLLNALAHDLDLRQAIPGSRFVKVKQLIDEQRIPVIFSFFDAPYFEGLEFDALVYDLILVNGTLVRKYSTNVVPINLRLASDGFMSNAIVAVFPENHLDHSQLPEERIFYILNKFVDRFKRITRPLLPLGVEAGTFERLHDLSDSEIERCASYWVWLHEYFHRQGSLPLPEGLDIKSSRPLAGLEECRVDVHGLLTLLNDDELPYEERLQASEFILAERLLRYAIEGEQSPNYDAIGSQILFNFLREHGALTVSQGRMTLTNELEFGLHRFVESIEEIESSVRFRSREQVKQALLQFTRRYTNYDHTSASYQHEPMFAELALRLRQLQIAQ